MVKQKKYTVGIYCRLSKDDDLNGESQSIGTQRSMLKSYCRENGYEVYREYIDDGYSGLNFDRPQFQMMLRDIEKQRIDVNHLLPNHIPIYTKSTLFRMLSLIFLYSFP